MQSHCSQWQKLTDNRSHSRMELLLLGMSVTLSLERKETKQKTNMRIKKENV